MTVQNSATEPAFYSSLKRLGVISVCGKDAERFLQGQISANVAHATPQFAPFGVFCTPKGRVIANVQLIRKENDHYWLVCHASLVDTLLTHLKKYGVFFKADLNQLDTYIYGVTGESSIVKDTFSLPSLPDTAHELLSTETTQVVKAAGTDRWLLIKESPFTPESGSTLLPEKDESFWWQQEICQGIVWLDETQTDKWLPQMINSEALASISFKKGCYTGQEVVARAHYRGQVKKRLARFSINNASSIQIGDDVMDTAKQRSVGTVVAAESVGQHTDLLAVVSLSDDERELTIRDNALLTEPLPYKVERLDPESLLAEALEDRI